jgi:dTDP-glucose 4,6-dehydratase
MRKNILITGGLGFIGSNFIEYFYENNNLKDFSITNLDKNTYAANLNNINKFKNNKNYSTIIGDINNKELVNYIFDKYQITDVINFAANSHVDNSISNPSIFIKSNIEGVCSLLDAAKNNWKDDLKKHKFIQISTDEVYGSLNLSSVHKWKEDEPLNPRSPYSASKASAEHLCMAYYKTYNFPVIITRSSNNFGPKQHKEKFIPTVLSSLKNNKPIPIYGNGENIRDWLYVKDNCKAINLALQKGKIGNVYNVGANNEINNKNLVNMIINIYANIYNSNINQLKKLISYVDDRLGHDLKYSVNINKIKELGWIPPTSNSIYNNLVNTIKEYYER